MPSSASIDLVICTYNHAPLLDRTLAALARQQVPAHVAWTVLVVDNNCTDETAAVVERHARAGRIPHLSRITEPEQGLTPARLCGVRHTTGTWIAFVDDDCLLQEDWIARAARFAQAHPACGAFGGRVILDWEVAPPDFVSEKFGYSFAEQDHGAEATEVDCLVGAGLVIRRKVLEESGWTRKPFLQDRVGTQLVSGGDVEIALRVGGTGHALWYTPACVLRHIIPERRISARYLIDVNYGLGISQIYGDALLWPGSYRAWLRATVRAALRSSVDVLRQMAKAILRRRPVTEAAITWSFVKGNWTAIAQMLRMDPEERRALLGCATTTAATTAGAS